MEELIKKVEQWSVERGLNTADPNKQRGNDIIKIFWENVDWHRRNKNIPWSAFYSGADGVNKMKNHELNVTLKKVQEIADKLDVDDYTILFERSDE